MNYESQEEADYYEGIAAEAQAQAEAEYAEEMDRLASMKNTKTLVECKTCKKQIDKNAPDFEFHEAGECEYSMPNKTLSKASLVENKIKPLKLTTKKVPRYQNDGSGEFKLEDTGEIEATPENLKKIQDKINEIIGYSDCSCYCHQAKDRETWSGQGCIHCKGYEIK